METATAEATPKPALSVEQKLKMRDLQLTDLAIKNRIAQLESDFKQTMTQATDARKVLQDLYNEYTAMGGDAYALNPNTLDFDPVTKAS